MADFSTPISAYAVHASKRKSLDNVPSSKRSKKKRASLGIFTPNETLKKSQKVKQFIERKQAEILNGNKKPSSSKKSSPVAKSSSPRKSKITDQKSTPELMKFPVLDRKVVVVDSSGEELKEKKIDAKTKIGTKKHVGRRIKLKSGEKKGAKMTALKIEQLMEKLPSVLQESDSESDMSDDCISSINEGKKLFEWLISPGDVENFFEVNWEKAPMYIKRSTPNYYKHVMSTPLLDTILRNNSILFTKNIDITSYSDGKRETHNPPGRALPSVVWDYYMNGCSIRFLNPQTYIPKLHTLNATLQEYFGCFVGANSYLTPPNSQGFAPHYDDIEAFILQIEGKKRWRLYKPRDEHEFLPRFSSANFDQSEIGEPIMDIVLNAGDLLYFPRGTIHQGETIDDTHSLHITLSMYQKNSWGDFLERLLPEALQQAIANDVEFREGLPMDCLRHVGLMHSGNETDARREIASKTKNLLYKLVDQYIDIDSAADKMAKKHIHDFLPPVLTNSEKECSVYGDGERMIKNGEVVNRVEIEPDTRVRLVKAQCARLIDEDDGLKVYYSCENSKEYHEFEPQFLEINSDLAPAIEEIIVRYPEYVRVEDLPIDGEDNKIQVVKDLWEKGIVVTDHPLPTVE